MQAGALDLHPSVRILHPVPTLYHPPALLIGLIVGFYWARVLRLVLKVRKRTGRAANFVPPERLGRALRAVWYPTVSLWILLPWLAALWRPVAAQLWYEAPWVAWPAVAVAAVALGLTMVCWRRMGTSWRMGIDPGETTALVVTGPFAWVRHPIYVLSAILMLASLAAVPHPVLAAAAVLHLAFLQWEARREERHLLAAQGEPYRDYLRHVGRFVPKSVKPYDPAGGSAV